MTSLLIRITNGICAFAVLNELLMLMSSWELRRLQLIVNFEFDQIIPKKIHKQAPRLNDRIGNSTSDSDSEN